MGVNIVSGAIVEGYNYTDTWDLDPRPDVVIDPNDEPPNTTITYSMVRPLYSSVPTTVTVLNTLSYFSPYNMDFATPFGRLAYRADAAGRTFSFNLWNVDDKLRPISKIIDLGQHTSTDTATQYLSIPDTLVNQGYFYLETKPMTSGGKIYAGDRLPHYSFEPVAEKMPPGAGGSWLSYYTAAAAAGDTGVSPGATLTESSICPVVLLGGRR